MMTEKQKNMILTMRAEGISFKDIAEELGMSLGRVKMFVSHHNRNNDRRYEQCGKRLANSDMGAEIRTVDTNPNIQPEHQSTTNNPDMSSEHGTIDVRRCAQCKKVLPGEARQTQRFCSHKCRNDWWNSHLDQLQSTRQTAYVCQSCGKRFTSHKNAKYCSRACFYASRRS